MDLKSLLFKPKEDSLMDAINQIAKECSWYSDIDEFETLCTGLKDLAEAKKTLEEAEAAKRSSRQKLDYTKILCTCIETLGAIGGVIILGKLEEIQFLPSKSSQMAMNMFKKK